MFDYHASDLDLWKFSGVCSIHGNYVYRMMRDEESVGCPVCTVKSLEHQIQELNR